MTAPSSAAVSGSAVAGSPAEPAASASSSSSRAADGQSVATELVAVHAVEPATDAELDRVCRAILDGVALRRQLLDRAAVIAAAAARVRTALLDGHKLLLCGNGGSASDCQHLAAELVGRPGLRGRPGLPAIALTTDSSVLTALSNDFGYEQVFARQVEALGRPGDVLLAISTSGESISVVRAAERARALGLGVIALVGPRPGALGPLAELCVSVPGETPDRIQELHITVGHILCEAVEQGSLPPASATAERR